jgi:hypothetical protein
MANFNYMIDLRNIKTSKNGEINYNKKSYFQRMHYIVQERGEEKSERQRGGGKKDMLKKDDEEKEECIDFFHFGLCDHKHSIWSFS